MRTMIVAGGELPPAFLNRAAEAYRPDYVIAADRGMDVLREAGRKPDLLLGDYDSAEEDESEIASSGLPYEVYPCEKDFSDLEAALHEAVRRGSTDITVLGATGGRLDHMLAAILNLMIPLASGIPARIADEQNLIALIDRRALLKRDGGVCFPEGKKQQIADMCPEADAAAVSALYRAVFGEHLRDRYVSLLPLAEQAGPVLLKGLYYTPEGLMLRRESASLGISNRFTAEKAELRTGGDPLVLVESVDRK